MCYLNTLLALLLFCSCNQTIGKGQIVAKEPAAKSAPADSAINFAAYNIKVQPEGTYAVNCASIKRERTALLSLYITGKIKADSVQHYFTEAILNRVLPHWYGTTWTFEGHTGKPGEGSIACGYLVSTSLSQAGLNINRYKVAQQDPYNEARTYACGDSVYTLRGLKSVTGTLLQPDFGEGLYFIGLSGSHVGMLLKRGGNLFFIHSNYVDGKTVIEDAATSVVLNYYDTFYVTPLSTNAGFIKKWLGNELMEVKTAR
jgi:hypothetical protein